MRIGILTLPIYNNYGGILQAYALQTVLEKMGHEVVVFYKPYKKLYPPLWIYPLCLAKRILRKCVNRKNPILLERFWTKRTPIVIQNLQRFVHEHIHLKTISALLQLRPADYDAIVVGSDQVWRPIYFADWRKPCGKIENAYLNFARDWDVKRIAYAASYGTSEWEYNEVQTARCKRLVQKFDAVSVREDSGVELCKKNFQVNAAHVLDPTMLLSRAHYCKLFIDKKAPHSPGSLLSYVLDESPHFSAFINRVASERNLKPFSVLNNAELDVSIPHEKCVKIPVEQWLRGFYDAEFVVTDSFHACVFSIIFQKQFLVVGNKERGMARFNSLLSQFGLQDRLVDTNVDLNQLPPIDYAQVEDRLNKLRKASLAFLSNHLSVSEKNVPWNIPQ